MTEQKPEKKVVSRTVAIALGIICIILVVSLVGAIADYTLIINGKDNTITTNNIQIQTLTNQKSQLQTFLEGNVSQTEKWLVGNETYDTSIINSENSQIEKEQTTITSLLSDENSLKAFITNLSNILNLSEYATWVNNQTVSQGASSYSTWTFSASYAGYVVVYVQSSNVSSTWLEVSYSSYGVNYNQAYTGSQAINVGNSAVFPLLPCPDITIGVGNGNAIGSATETVTITYWY